MNIIEDIKNFLIKRNLIGFYGFENESIPYDSYFNINYCFPKIKNHNIDWRFKNEQCRQTSSPYLN